MLPKLEPPESATVIPVEAAGLTLAQPTQPGLTDASIDETQPLLPTNVPTRKHWYRPRPLWLVPFAVAASISRGMTLAPRVEVFTQLACERLKPIYFNHTSIGHIPSFDIIQDNVIQLNLTTSEASVPWNIMSGKEDTSEDLPSIGGLPSKQCIEDPQVQAGASRLQTVMTTTMGLLSALTTGWWGRLSERRGRLTVLAFCVAGLLFTDLMFVFASSRVLGLGRHSYALLLIAPVVEGLLGGYSTLQATATSYVSDCTSDGSRANIFSRFHGVFFVGIAVGPEIGALLIRQSNGTSLVFIVSACLGTANLLLSCLVFPESLTPARREQLSLLRPPSIEGNDAKGWMSYPMALVAPLAVFLPRKREHRKGLDWNFPALAAALSCYLLTVGMYQTKYLYATHTYSWGAEQLSYYITFLGTSRTFHLLLLLPYIMRSFKPPCPPQMKYSPDYPKILAKEMHFDIIVAKSSLILDILSHSLVALLDPSYMYYFVGASSLTSLGGGALPSLQSLAICISQTHEDQGGIGELLGAVSFLGAVGSMILGPLLFGLVFSETVAFCPKAIFILAAALLGCSVTFLSLIRPNRKLDAILQERDEQNRGRSRASKTLQI